MRATTTLLLAAISAALVSELRAQAHGSSRSTFCAQGAPANRCALFPIIEAGAHLRLTDHRPGATPILVNYALSFMANSGARTALGAEIFAGYEGEIRGGVALRMRRWLGPHTGLDVTAGVHLFGSANSDDPRCDFEFPGDFTCGASPYSATVARGSPMLQARLGYRDIVAVSTRLDVLRMTGYRQDCSSGQCESNLATRTSARLYLGAEVGSHAGLAAQVATGLAVVVVGVVAVAAWEGPFGR